MTVLITGASGHVGANIVAHLCRAGLRPRVLLRPTSSTAGIADLDVEAVIGDITRPDSLTAAMKGVAVVYHAAAAVGFSRRQRDLLDRVNVQGTQNVIDACLGAGVQRMVFTSSVAAVGHAPSRAQPIDETATWNFGEHDLVYADSKYRSEGRVHRAVREHNLSAVIVNPALVFGERDVNLNAGKMLVQVQKGGVLVSGPGSQAVCDADDVAAAHLAAAERGVDGRRYIVSSAHFSYTALLTKVAEAVGGRAPLVTLPAGLIRTAGRLAEAVLPAPMVTWEIAVQSTLHSAFDARRVPDELGVPYTPFDQTLEKTRRWLVAHGHLQG